MGATDRPPAFWTAWKAVHATLISTAVAGLFLGQGLRSQAEDDVYQKPSEFLVEVLGADLPPPRLVTLSDKDRGVIEELLGSPYGSRRVRYWTKANRSVWLLNVIGKTRPITVGLVIREGKIEALKVLVYRETHGYEVKEKFFTRQFEGAQLRPDNRLDKPIDGIAGATLSSRALERIARVALYLDGRRLAK